MKLVIRQLASVALMSLVASFAAAQAQDSVLQSITVRGTVEAIDHTARTVRIRGTQGNVVTFDVPASVTRFDQVRIGDQLTIAYYDRVSIRPKPAGEAAVDRVSDSTTTSAAGLLPSGTQATQRVTTATIDSWDPATRTVTFTTLSGHYTRRVSEAVDASVLGVLKPGDRVDVTRTEALRLDVEAGAPAQPAAPSPLHSLVDASRWVADVAVGISPSINGNINSGAIGSLQGQAAAILPNTYGHVYGTGLDLRFGAGFKLNDVSELRGVFIYQSADADLVRLGDVGPSSLYGQYSDYKVLALDFGYRHYMPIPSAAHLRLFGEGTIGIGAIDRINLQLAAPQSNLLVNNTDFYDGTSAFTWSVAAGVVFPIASHVDLTAQLGLRHVGGMADVDQLVGTSLESINDDSSRLTVPVVVGLRFRFK